MIEKIFLRYWLAVIAVTAALCAAGCVAAGGSGQPLLNSERIEARYGSYGVRVLSQDETFRVSCLYSRHAGNEICRTLAVVRFESAVPAPLEPPLARIRDGASLGATLREAGFEVIKRNVAFDGLGVDGESYPGIIDLLGLPRAAEVAIHRYDLDARSTIARSAMVEAAVARVFELHHPDYQSLDALRDYYSGLPESSRPPSSSADTLDAWLHRLESAASSRAATPLP